MKSTEKTTSSIKLRLDRFIGEVLPNPPRQAKAHLISVIGGEHRLRRSERPSPWETSSWSRGPDLQPMRVCLERNPQCFKGSVQLAGRKKPLRHLIALSEDFASSNVSASSGRTLLASSENGFIWASIAHIHGIPGVPDWAEWFAEELNTHRAIMPALGIGCDPVIVHGEKEQLLDWLRWGVESEAIRFPAETGSIHRPSLGLKEIVFQACASSAQ
ncbi:MAG: hypothetical protein WBV55_19060 [Candidatus Sulfotelmatobacter sp.]